MHNTQNWFPQIMQWLMKYQQSTLQVSNLAKQFGSLITQCEINYNSWRSWHSPCPRTAVQTHSRCRGILTRDYRDPWSRSSDPWTLPSGLEEHFSFGKKTLFPSPGRCSEGGRKTWVFKRKTKYKIRGFLSWRDRCTGRQIERLSLNSFFLKFFFLFTCYFTAATRSTTVLLSEEKMWVRIEMSPGLSATFMIITRNTSARNQNQILCCITRRHYYQGQ